MNNTDNWLYGKASGNSKTKEINISFTESQGQGTNRGKEIQYNNSNKTIKPPVWQKKINWNIQSANIVSNTEKEDQIETVTHTKQSLKQIEKMIWMNNISQLQSQIENYKKWSCIKSNILQELKAKEHSNPKNEFEKINEELSLVKWVQKEKENGLMRVFQLKKQVKYWQSIITKCKEKERFQYKPNETFGNNKVNNLRNNNWGGFQFTRLETHDIGGQYEGLMTTAGGNELCKSRLGNKMLMSLDVGEINRNQDFRNAKLAYPIIQRKKIIFDLKGAQDKIAMTMANEERGTGNNMGNNKNCGNRKKFCLDLA